MANVTIPLRNAIYCQEYNSNQSLCPWPSAGSSTSFIKVQGSESVRLLDAYSKLCTLVWQVSFLLGITNIVHTYNVKLCCYLPSHISQWHALIKRTQISDEMWHYSICSAVSISMTSMYDIFLLRVYSVSFSLCFTFCFVSIHWCGFVLGSKHQLKSPAMKQARRCPVKWTFASGKHGSRRHPNKRSNRQLQRQQRKKPSLSAYLWAPQKLPVSARGCRTGWNTAALELNREQTPSGGRRAVRHHSHPHDPRTNCLNATSQQCVTLAVWWLVFLEPSNFFKWRLCVPKSRLLT